jgi:hypothetical protein
MRLEDRERVVLEVLRELPKEDVVLVGGYALNAYVPPRFSVDCDLVVLGRPGPLEKVLRAHGFRKADEGEVPYGAYVRYFREEEKVSFDLLINAVQDRATGTTFGEKLVRRRSAVRATVGRVSPMRIELRIADPELLFAMKFVPGRRQDIRDLFMLAGEDLQWGVVKEILRDSCTPGVIADRARLVGKTVSAAGYRDSLQGPYGKIPDARFERCKRRLLEFVEELDSPDAG